MIEPKLPRWLNPIAMDQLQQAVRRKRETVVLDGTRYKIKYGFTRRSKITDEIFESVHLSREDGVLVPRGYVSVKEIENFRFEGE